VIAQAVTELDNKTTHCQLSFEAYYSMMKINELKGGVEKIEHININTSMLGSH
jgi:hypothetical protein